MKYLITGANGFIGNCLTKTLLEKGHSVRCLIRKESDLTQLKDLPLEYYTGSLLEPSSLLPALDGVDYIFNFAGKTRALKNSEYFQTNALGAKNLFQAAQEACPKIKRILHVSSLAAAGPSQTTNPLTEEDPPHPVTPYGESKLESEKIAHSFSDLLPITIIRPPVVYGPSDKSGFALFKSAAKGLNISIGNRNPLLMPIYVQDLVNAAYHLAHAPAAVGETFFVCGAEITSPAELFKILSSAVNLNSPSRTIRIPPLLAALAVFCLELRAQLVRRPNRLNSAKLTELKYPAWLASSKKASSLGVEHKTTLSQGLLQTLTWYQNAGWL